MAVLHFLKVPRSRQKIAEFLGSNSVVYAIQTYITSLEQKGFVCMTKPKSHTQRFVALL